MFVYDKQATFKKETRKTAIIRITRKNRFLRGTQLLIDRMADVVKDQNTPLLEQKEENKTKLPFCIFLLCNGAVGTEFAKLDD